MKTSLKYFASCLSIILFALVFFVLAGCFGGDKMMQIENGCHEVLISTSNDMRHVKLVHRQGWTFAEGWKKHEKRWGWDGRVNFYRPNGSLYKTVTIKAGRYDGESIFYYTNGYVAEQGYMTLKKDLTGIQSSNCIYFSPTGDSITEAEYEQKKYWSLVEQWLKDF